MRRSIYKLAATLVVALISAASISLIPLFARTTLAQTETAPTRNGDTLYIANLDNLAWLQDANNDTAWSDANDYFKQTANIDASPTSGWNSNAGFGPIGTSQLSNPFKGVYDGGGYLISGLHENNTSTLGGMFGYTASATLKNIVLVSESITANGTNAYVGGLLAFPDGNGGTTTVNGCSTSGTITSSSGSNIGGLVGISSSGTTIEDSYSSANVTCTSSSSPVGGLVGDNNGSIRNCYTIGGSVQGGSSADVGGLAGENNSGTVQYCYSANTITGGSSTATGGLIGYNYLGSVTNNFWDTDSSGSTGIQGYPTTGATGETTSNMKTESTFTGASWDFTNTWAINSNTNSGFPYLQTAPPDHSLPVQAIAFLATADMNSVTLSWNTQSEVDNAGFNILREDPGTSSFKLLASYIADGSLRGLGTSSTGRAYNYTDDKIISGSTYQYEIQSVSTNGTTKDLSTLTVTVDVPKNYALYQNYPNPFNPSTTIRFDLKEQSMVILEIYDVLGQRVYSENYGSMNAGRFDEVVNMDRFASGVYFYHITAQGNDGQKFDNVKKLMLIK
ncbi:MAG TPA: T9SS type A sorting domain-containing protein [Candidatus Acidoferrales bacterium]|nr:T9SS type A sorting domain-containing protein [Candidatus Acidoferrales bacterium]